MWRERLGACCFVGSIPFDFSTGTGRGFFACNRSQCNLSISEVRISLALYRSFLLSAYVL